MKKVTKTQALRIKRASDALEAAINVSRCADKCKALALREWHEAALLGKEPKTKKGR